jgi:transcriptional regulator with XRE-family HTH domain
MDETLSSWKEIARYIGKSVRTVQRWEADLALPVRRPNPKAHNKVIALKAELDSWLLKRMSPRVAILTPRYGDQVLKTQELIAITLRETERASQCTAKLIEKLSQRKIQR